VLSAEGGFGRTYLAEDTDKLNEKCVVKQLAPKVQGTSALKKATELFQEEAKRLHELGIHRQIPTLLACFEEDNFLYLVQELIDGQNLLAELKQQGKYSESKIRELLLDLLPILQFIHERQVIHRDIKPQNLMRRKEDGRLVLIDFGASKQFTATVMIKAGTQIGTHGYTPLEQIKGGEAYPASDLYSLGATCFHLLTEVEPFELWVQQGYGWVTNWREYLPSSVSDELVEVLDKLLKVNVNERYQSAYEVIVDLMPKAASKSPVQPSPPLVTPNWEKVALAQTLTGHSDPVTSVAISPDGQTLASGSWDKNIKLWDLATGTQILTLTGHSDLVDSVAISPDSKIVASGSKDKTIKLWDLATGTQILTLTGHSDWVYSVAISPDSKIVVSASADNTIKLWDLATRKQIRTFIVHSDEVYSVAISPDSKIIASGSRDRTIKLWDLATGKQIRTFTGHSNSVVSIVISPDAKTIVSGSWDNTIKLWDLATGKEIRTLTGHSSKVYSVAISPDGKTVVSGSRDNTIKLWDLATGNQIRTLTEHSKWVCSVAFSPDGQTLVSGSSDNTIKIWRVAS